MKKGFTLIELLIVMVIVGVLVTIVLPKYNASMERGRSLEALSNLRATSEVLNTRYVLNNNSYTCTGAVDTSTREFKIGSTPTANLTKAVHFDSPKVVSCSNSGNMSVTTARKNGDYTLTAYNENGELKYITCTVGAGASSAICENIGAEWDSTSSTYRMDFSN